MSPKSDLSHFIVHRFSAGAACLDYHLKEMLLWNRMNYSCWIRWYLTPPHPLWFISFFCSFLRGWRIGEKHHSQTDAHFTCQWLQCWVSMSFASMCFVNANRTALYSLDIICKHSMQWSMIWSKNQCNFLAVMYCSLILSIYRSRCIVGPFLQSCACHVTVVICSMY